MKTNNILIRKSTRLAIMVLAGKINLGKYTFVNKDAFEISELLLSVNEAENNCHGIIPTRTNKGYGTPSEGSLAILLNTIVNTIIVSTGRKIVHKIPKTVCLYLTVMSLQANIKNNSLKEINSFQ